MCTCSEPPRRCEGKWALLKLWGQLGLLEGGVGIIIIIIIIIVIIIIIIIIIIIGMPNSLGMPF